MQSLTATDWAILEFLSRDPSPVGPLLASHPKATVYKRLAALRDQGLVAKRGRGYLLTSAGAQVKAEREAEGVAGGLTDVYPPLREVPTPPHRAMLELAFAAAVHRQHADQDEHHAGFLLLGPTMAWKTSAGAFLCHALGVDPAVHVVDLSAESGKSLWIRRGPTGEIVAQRALLDAPVVVFDEYQSADREVRRAVAPFLSGRRRVAVENTLLTIAPVPLVTMNPGAGESLAARTGFSVPQLRRLVPCDFSAVDLPDLALEGGRAVEAARQAGLLTRPAPRGSCVDFRAAVVTLLRDALVPEALNMVDVELLLGLGHGLTAWLPVTAAMRLALHDVLLVLETVGWTQPGWVERVRTFTAVREEREPTGRPALTGAPPVPAAQRQAPTVLSLFPERHDGPTAKEGSPMTTPRESLMPSFTLSEQAKAKLIWLAEETQASLDQAVYTLVDVFVVSRLDGMDYGSLLAIVRLRKECRAAGVEVAELRQFLADTASLREQDLDVAEVGAALAIAEQLETAGLSFDQVKQVAELLEALEQTGLDPSLPDQLREALERYGALGYSPERITPLATLAAPMKTLEVSVEDLEHLLQLNERLRTLGLDAERAEALATALTQAGVAGDQWADVLTQVVETAAVQVDLAALTAERKALREEIAGLEAERAEYQDSLTTLQAAVVQAAREEGQAAARLTALRKQASQWEDRLVAAEACERLVLGTLDPADPFVWTLDALVAARRKLPGAFPEFERWLTKQLQGHVKQFLARIAAMAPTT
mgnify:CR=1 FL=1